MSRRAAFVFVALLPLLPLALATACSDPPAKPGPAIGGATTPTPGKGGATDGGSEGSVTDSGGLDAEGGVCNDIVLTSLIVDRIAMSTDPPVSTGGMIVDGQYDLTLYTAYVGTSGVGGPTGITAKATMVLSAGKITEVIELGGSGKTASTTRTSGGYAANGVTFAETEFCPTTGGGKQLQFTANDPTLVLTDPITKEAFTFTKR